MNPPATPSRRTTGVPAPLPVRESLVLRLILLPLLLAALALPWAARAQDEEPEDENARLIEQEPFDLLQLDAANNNEVFKLVPLDRSKIPADPKPGDKLRIRLKKKPEQQYDVDWRFIVKLRLYEQMILDEVAPLTAQGKSKEAWDNLAFLLERYPGLPGLEKARQDYLYAEAGRLYVQQKYDAALAVLEELQGLNAAYSSGGRNLNDVLGAVIDKVSGGYVNSGSYIAARKLLDRIDRKFKQRQQLVVEKWRRELARLAEAKSSEARELVAAEKFLEARTASREVLEIWPDLPGAQELAGEIAEKFPVVVVGVAQPAASGNPASFDNWADRRVGRLTRRSLVEFEGHRPDGGQYTTPLGELQLSDDRQRITFDISPTASKSAFDVSSRLLALADRSNPAHDRLWAHLLDSVEVQDVYRAEARLRAPHVLPQALLQIPLSETPGGRTAGAAAPAGRQPAASADGPYLPTPLTGGDVRYAPNPSYKQAPGSYDLLEHLYADTRTLAQALRRGEVDVVDRLFPADAVRLRQDPSIVVEPYALPNMQMLLANPDHPYTANATFRRGLMYGIDRETILGFALLEGGKIEGCRVVSGPFPPGITPSDSWAYGYDTEIRPYPFEPRLALTLVELAKREVAEQAKKVGQPTPKLKKLVLAHPADDIAAVVCAAISEQLALVGIECQLKQLPRGQTIDTSENWDLLFLEAAMWEPFVDARRLMEIEPVAKLHGDYVRMAQQRLDLAPNETEGRRRLRELHNLMHQEVTVIPLWQMVHHLGHHRSITGVGSRPLFLYENASGWRRVSESAVAAK